jgi:subtilisin family serine protease
MTAPAPDLDRDVPTTKVDNELIVDLRYLNLVIRELTGNGIRVAGTPEENRQLDLARLTLAGRNDLDELLRTLSTRFAELYGGWTPLLDTNQHVGHVLGMPQPESQGSEDPQPAIAPRAAKFTESGDRVRVGVLDTRIYPHPDLVGRFLAEPGSCYQPQTDAVPARAGHATFVTSLVLREAPAALVEVRAVLNYDGVATSWDTAKAMIGFADSDADILNLSLGCRTSDGKAPLVLSRVVDRLSQRMVIVAAAGNHGNTSDALHKAPTWPAALSDVIAVGARRDGRTLADFSPRLPWVTCTAPGQDITGAYLNGLVQTPNSDVKEQTFTGYAKWSGTSFAAAITSGVIAAHTRPGEVAPHEAVAQVLRETNGVVRPFTQCQDGECA